MNGVIGMKFGNREKQEKMCYKFSDKSITYMGESGDPG